ncbi:hypothetical protein CK203_106585 [Vitis vinifera]|uniref:Uncharacterized protein n=1 Tax=Vitis vinifera TaxID=29760 RepID=A0A438CG88_VITVI|nr:hypothetical protein CK203_106585 [Vitis vinifera]
MGNGMKEMQDAVTRQAMSLITLYFDMGSNNMRQQLVLQPVVEEKPMFKMMEEPQPAEPPLNARLVVINVTHKPDARLPFPNPYEIINIGDAVGFELDWTTSLVILETKHPRCPRQEGGFKCGYFVMRFIKEIIFYHTIVASKVLLI